MTSWKICCITALLSVLTIHVYSLEEMIYLGREDGWKDMEFAGITKETGKKGFFDLLLADGEYSSDNQTDLLLHFNTSPLSVYPGNYTVKNSSITLSSRYYYYGSSAGVFQNEREGISLKPGPGALFQRGTEWGDFSIEFWLYPAHLGEGETILLWQGTEKIDGRIVPQEFRCSIKERKIQWDFTNFFLPPGKEPLTLTLTGTTRLIPRVWHHHILRFDSSTGLLEYALDGSPDGITYTNDQNRESRTIAVPRIGNLSTSNLIIGRNFTGILDEMRISPLFIEEPFIRRYAQKTGTAVSRIFDLGYNNSQLSRIEAMFDTPGGTDVSFYFRTANNFTEFQESSSPPLEWIQFSPGTVFTAGNRGRYAQIMVELYPDGYGNNSPRISEIEIVYEPDYPPSPPAMVTALPGNKSITLQWSPVESPDVQGYLLYYGNEPGNYFGSDSSLGPSPVDLGNTTSVTLENLTNGKLYYFSLAAYDSADPPHLSDYSKEIFARPSALLRRNQ